MSILVSDQNGTSLQLARIIDDVTGNFGMKELPGPTLLDVSQGL
jgi:hypothetical protein